MKWFVVFNYTNLYNYIQIDRKYTDILNDHTCIMYLLNTKQAYVNIMKLADEGGSTIEMRQVSTSP